MKKEANRISRCKNPESKRYRRDMARYLDRKTLKCVTKREEDGSETVIGRGGDLLVSGDEFRVYASGEVLLRCRITEMSAWELLSMDGVMITAPDLEHGGEIKSVIAYYQYWRQVEN